METEYITLSTTLRELILLKHLINVVIADVGLNGSNTTIKLQFGKIIKNVLI